MKDNKHYSTNVILPGLLLGVSFFTIMITPQKEVGQNAIALEIIIVGVAIVWLVIGLFQWRRENRDYQKKQNKR
ncbi:hypothetical protein ABC628_05735 [Lentilactobacillus otakiensis]|uniref:hypothetical protein n=1 Tax=Lentilactobacillus otakiensis TaxID=481720 RepID=UPI000586A434|nr:hypothetical protein [Lentilactobacillus otakiensis]MBZ3776860.1 hypothetical protein [Lentilactobacillus otakiensis]MDV3518478.1 hypothetical protein [Lentilactobacillus otakiensis]